jgi:hypothetical protein
VAENRDKQMPHLTDAALAAKAERETRQAEALRANLRRRRAQGHNQSHDQNQNEDTQGESSNKESDG